VKAPFKPSGARSGTPQGRTTLYGLFRDGQLRAVHIGRSCRLTRAELMRYVEHLDQRAPKATSRTPELLERAEAGDTLSPRTASQQDRLFDLEHPPDAGCVSPRPLALRSVARTSAR
jgi:excisionase family DNA binding protein